MPLIPNVLGALTLPGLPFGLPGAPSLLVKIAIPTPRLPGLPDLPGIPNILGALRMPKTRWNPLGLLPGIPDLIPKIALPMPPLPGLPAIPKIPMPHCPLDKD